MFFHIAVQELGFQSSDQLARHQGQPLEIVRIFLRSKLRTLSASSSSCATRYECFTAGII